MLDITSGRIPATDLDVMEFSRQLCTDLTDRVRAIGGIAKEFDRV